jgi:hypothetical protein
MFHSILFGAKQPSLRYGRDESLFSPTLLLKLFRFQRRVGIRGAPAWLLHVSRNRPAFEHRFDAHQILLDQRLRVGSE